MPNKDSAKKALRQSAKRAVRNLAKKRKIKELVKSSLTAIESKASEVQKIVSATAKVLDKAAKSNTIHRNRAARVKSRLQRKLNALK